MNPKTLCANAQLHLCSSGVMSEIFYDKDMVARFETFVKLIEDNADEYYLICVDYTAEDSIEKYRLFAIETVNEADTCVMSFQPYAKEPEFSKTGTAVFYQCYDVETGEEAGEPFCGDDVWSMEDFEHYVQNQCSERIMNYFGGKPIFQSDVEKALELYQNVPFKVRICKDCGRHFPLRDGEKDWFNERGLALPVRCQDCRDKRKQQKRDEALEKEAKEHGFPDVSSYLDWSFERDLGNWYASGGW